MTMRPDICRYIFDVIDDPIFLHDAQFRILFANDAYCREAGMPEAQLLGQLYWEVFPLGSGPLPGCSVVANEKNGTGSLDEVSVGTRVFLSRGYTLRADAAQPGYSVHIFSDITAIRQVQSNLARQLEEVRRGYDAMLGREMRIIELKKEVNQLLLQAGQPLRYPSANPPPLDETLP